VDAKRQSLDGILRDIRACRICRDNPRYGTPLPHEPRPVCVAGQGARILIAGQAPGTRVNETGIPFNDPSGNRLREWMDIERPTFYDSRRIAIVPMGFCFPGQDAKGGDLPPRRECCETWHPHIMKHLTRLRLVLAVGMYAHRYYLGDLCGRTLTETVRRWREIREAKSGLIVYPLPHPSWRNNGWLRKNPWFETDLLPCLKRDIRFQLE
jgi:uracil-DNA glycosylase